MDSENSSDEEEAISKQIVNYYKKFSQNRELPKYFRGTSISYMPEIVKKGELGDEDIPQLHAEPTPIDERIASEGEEAKVVSPASSLTSNRKLEWDNGADIGYDNCQSSSLLHKSFSLPILTPKLKSPEKIDKVNSNPEVNNKSTEKVIIISIDSSTSINAESSKKSSLTSSELHSHRKQTDSTTSSTASEPAPQVSSSSSSNISKKLGTLSYLKDRIGSPDAESTPKFLERIKSDPQIYPATPHHKKPEKPPRKLMPKSNTDLKATEKVIFLCRTKAQFIECIDVKKQLGANKKIQTSIVEKLSKSTQTTDSIENFKTDDNRKVHRNQSILFVCSESETEKSTQTDSDVVISQCNSFEFVQGEEVNLKLNQNIQYDPVQNTSSSITTKSNSDQSSLEPSLPSNHSETLVGDINKAIEFLPKLIKSRKYNSKTKKRYIKSIVQKILESSYIDDSTTSSELFLPKKSIQMEEIIPTSSTSDGDRKYPPKLEENVPWYPASFNKKLTVKTFSDEILPTIKPKENDVLKRSRFTLTNNEFIVNPSEGTSTSLEKNHSSLSSNKSNYQSWKNDKTMSEMLLEKKKFNCHGEGDHLVRFAKEERQHQLAWIRDEISHLSKLKLLLEKNPKNHLPLQSTSTKTTTVYMLQNQVSSSSYSAANSGRNYVIQTELGDSSSNDGGPIDFRLSDQEGNQRNYIIKEQGHSNDDGKRIVGNIEVISDETTTNIKVKACRLNNCDEKEPKLVGLGQYERATFPRSNAELKGKLPCDCCTQYLIRSNRQIPDTKVNKVDNQTKTGLCKYCNKKFHNSVGLDQFKPIQNLKRNDNQYLDKESRNTPFTIQTDKQPTEIQTKETRNYVQSSCLCKYGLCQPGCNCQNAIDRENKTRMEYNDDPQTSEIVNQPNKQKSEEIASYVHKYGRTRLGCTCTNHKSQTDKQSTGDKFEKYKDNVPTEYNDRNQISQTDSQSTQTQNKDGAQSSCLSKNEIIEIRCACKHQTSRTGQTDNLLIVNGNRENVKKPKESIGIRCTECKKKDETLYYCIDQPPHIECKCKDKISRTGNQALLTNTGYDLRNQIAQPDNNSMRSGSRHSVKKAQLGSRYENETSQPDNQSIQSKDKNNINKFQTKTSSENQISEIDKKLKRFKCKECDNKGEITCLCINVTTQTECRCANNISELDKEIPSAQIGHNYKDFETDNELTPTTSMGSEVKAPGDENKIPQPDKKSIESGSRENVKKPHIGRSCENQISQTDKQSIRSGSKENVKKPQTGNSYQDQISKTDKLSIRSGSRESVKRPQAGSSYENQISHTHKQSIRSGSGESLKKQRTGSSYENQIFQTDKQSIQSGSRENVKKPHTGRSYENQISQTDKQSIRSGSRESVKRPQIGSSYEYRNSHADVQSIRSGSRKSVKKPQTGSSYENPISQTHKQSIRSGSRESVKRPQIGSSYEYRNSHADVQSIRSGSRESVKKPQTGSSYENPISQTNKQSIRIGSRESAKKPPDGNNYENHTSQLDSQSIRSKTKDDVNKDHTESSWENQISQPYDRQSKQIRCKECENKNKIVCLCIDEAIQFECKCGNRISQTDKPTPTPTSSASSSSMKQSKRIRCKECENKNETVCLCIDEATQIECKCANEILQTDKPVPLTSTALSSSSSSTTESESSNQSSRICPCCKRSSSTFTTLKHKLNNQLCQLCQPCYRRHRYQIINYNSPGHVCNCYTMVQTKTLNEIKRTVYELNEFDKQCCTCQGPKSSYCKYCRCKLKKTTRSQNGIAYMLTFEPGIEVRKQSKSKPSLQEIKIKIPVPVKKKHKEKENLKKQYSEDSDCNRKPTGSTSTLEDYLNKNRPGFVKRAETRRQILLDSQLQREGVKDYNKLMYLKNVECYQSQRLFSSSEMKEITKKNYKKLPEVQKKLIDNREKRIRQANRLITDTFNRKLKENVLQGRRNLPIDAKVVNL